MSAAHVHFELCMMNYLRQLFARQTSSPVVDYTLYRPKIGETEPDELLLFYEWDESFENEEFRLCVKHFPYEVEMRGHEVKGLPSPPFTPGEDLVKIEFLVDEVCTTFRCDYLISLIEITTADARVIRSLWNDIGNKIGWCE